MLRGGRDVLRGSVFEKTRGNILHSEKALGRRNERSWGDCGAVSDGESGVMCGKGGRQTLPSVRAQRLAAS